MEGTCNPKECKLYDLLGGTPDQCPNYIEGWWKPEEGVPALVKDCAPKRNFLMMQDVFNRILSLQQANEQQRNESAKVTQIFDRIVRVSQAQREMIDLKEDL